MWFHLQADVGVEKKLNGNEKAAIVNSKLFLESFNNLNAGICGIR